jgi:hypothetical protein
MAHRNVFQVTAAIIAETIADTDSPAGKAAVATVARRLADQYRTGNPEFRYGRFFDACGLDSWGELLPNPVHRS